MSHPYLVITHDRLLGRYTHRFVSLAEAFAYALTRLQWRPVIRMYGASCYQREARS